MLLKAANTADLTAKAYRTVSTSAEFKEIAEKATKANEAMITSVNKTVEAQKEQAKAQQTIIKLAKETNTSWRSVIGTLEQNISQNEKYKNELKFVSDKIKEQIKLNTDARGVLRNVSTELIELRAREAELKQSISENNITIRQQSKEMLAAEGSMKQVSLTLGLMKQAYRELNDAEKQSDFGQSLLSQIQEIDSSMKQSDETIGNFFRNVGDYKNSFANAFDEILSGNFKGAVEQVDTSFKSLVASARAFIASPIGIAVAAIAGIGLAGKAIFDYNNGLRENLVLTEQFTGLTGEMADSVRQNAQALSDTFGNDFQENLNAAQKLVKAFKISYDEAFDEIAEGLANGGVANKEFFDSINEYPQLFSNAGYSAKEFINLVNTGFTQGLFSDKLVDGLKEADLSLREQTTATRDALVNAFGAPFTDELLRRIKTGETTTKEALIEISSQAQKTGLNVQQLSQLTADVFRGAGEDVGGAAKFFDVLNSSVDNLGEPLTETSKHFKDLRDANVELQEAMDAALKSDSVISFTQNLEVGWVKTKTVFFQVIESFRKAYEWYDKISGRSKALSSIWASLSQIGDKIGEVFDYVSVTVERLAEKFGISTDDTNDFMNALTYLTDPIKVLDVLIQSLVYWVELAADGFVKTTTYAEAFGRSLGQIASLDFSNLKSIGDNAKDIENENKIIQEQINLRKRQAEGQKAVAKVLGDIANASKIALEDQKETEREKAKAAEESLKLAEKNKQNQEKQQRAYAAEQKKRAEEQKRLLEQQAREEIEKNAAILEHFKLTNEKRLEFSESFTMDMIADHKNYLETLFKMEKDHAEKVAGISFEQAQNIDIDKRTSEQQKLVNTIIALEKKKADDIKKIEDDLDKYMDSKASDRFETEKKRLALDYAYNLLNSDNKLKAEIAYNEKISELVIENFEKRLGLSAQEVEQKYLANEQLTAAEISFLDYLFEIRKADQERRDKLKEEDREKDLKGLEQSLETIGEYLGAEQQMRDAFEAYKALLKAKDINDTEGAEKAKLQIIANVASAAATIMGEYTAFGKAAAMVSAMVNTALAIINALTVQPPWLGIALSVAIGAMGAMQIAKIAAQQPPQAPRFNAAFASGVVDSEYQGKALVDEEGPELHFDKFGRLKSAGLNRPNIREVKKGDTIIPADISKKIKDLIGSNYKPEIYSEIQANDLIDRRDYDFKKLERKLDHVSKTISDKPTYVWTGSKLIEVVGAGGNSYQREVPSLESKYKPKPNKLN